jgi:hypothetical protein
MATETVVDATEKKPDGGTQQQNNQPKMFEESYVKELIGERDKVKEKLRKIEADAEAATKKAQEAQLKAANDFEGLTKLHQTEHEKAMLAARSLIVNNFMTSLAVKHGLQDPADIALFNAEIELDDDYQVTNAKDVEKAFEDWKKSKSYLFKVEDKRFVPKTDNYPYRKAVDQSGDGKKTVVPLVDILQQRANKS